MDGSFGLIFSPDRTQVLLVKRRDVPIWELPGGCIEKDESPEMAVVREVFEETGYRVDPIRKIGQYYYPKKLKTNHYYECMIVDGEKRLSNESKAVDYFNINALPEMLLPETALC
ncbi:NUDIX domain-containing protein, partial [Patescibacteria group bacterium]|nr:NUDIX domain-containing protein [Patescibacteria group bacterium]